MSRGAYSILLMGAAGCSLRIRILRSSESTRSTAALHRTDRWWSMVVSDGCAMTEGKTLSNPHTEKSPGTAHPCDFSSARMPAAVMSFTPMSAVAFVPRSSAAAVSRRPTVYS